jgi:hypothetical protein
MKSKTKQKCVTLEMPVVVNLSDLGVVSEVVNEAISN